MAVTGSQILLSELLISNGDSRTFSHDSINKLADEMTRLEIDSLSQGKFVNKPPIHVPKDLNSCSHVWLRTDRIRRSLEAPYSGPYKVLERFPKYFVIELPSGKSTVSIDRLKPVILQSPCLNANQNNSSSVE